MKQLLFALVFALSIGTMAHGAEAGFAGRISNLYQSQFQGHYVYHQSGVPGNRFYPYWLGQLRAPWYFRGPSSCGGYSYGIQSHHAINGHLYTLTGNRCQTNDKQFR